MTDTHLERLADRLAESPDYRVVRRLQRVTRYADDPADDTTIRTGIYLDTETTGFDEDVCKIIELAMLKFEFASDGRIFRIVAEYDEFNDPGEPIPEEIVRLTGISDEMVRGQRIDASEVERFFAGVNIVIAHNAGFDRRFVEAHLTGFDALPWACSQSQVDWAGAGFESSKLEYLAYRQGFFYDGHRAITDCLAGVHLLTLPIGDDDHAAFSELLATARTKQTRIYAKGSPFETKDVLRNRGYRWNPGDNGKHKAWYVDVDQADLAAELDFLEQEIFHRKVRLPTEEITPFNRFSSRI